ncbi:Oligopeptidase A, partial [Pseudomonas syringae pv. cerasicola]
MRMATIGSFFGSDRRAERVWLLRSASIVIKMVGCFFQPRCKTVSANNPLLQSYDLPPFSAIRAEHVKPAVEKILADNRAAIADILAKQGSTPTWAGLV